MNQLQSFQQQRTSGKDFSFLKPGLTIKVHQKIKDGEKTRVQIFEGIVIAQKHGKGLDGMVTIRKIASGIGVERTFPLFSPSIEKFEVVKAAKSRRAKLYYLRDKTAKETRKKTRLLDDETKKAQAGAAVQDIEETTEPMEVETKTTEETIEETK